MTLEIVDWLIHFLLFGIVYFIGFGVGCWWFKLKIKDSKPVGYLRINTSKELDEPILMLDLDVPLYQVQMSDKVSVIVKTDTYA